MLLVFWKRAWKRNTLQDTGTLSSRNCSTSQEMRIGRSCLLFMGTYTGSRPNWGSTKWGLPTWRKISAAVQLAERASLLAYGPPACGAAEQEECFIKLFSTIMQVHKMHLNTQRWTSWLNLCLLILRTASSTMPGHILTRIELVHYTAKYSKSCAKIRIVHSASCVAYQL